MHVVAHVIHLQKWKERSDGARRTYTALVQVRADRRTTYRTLTI